MKKLLILLLTLLCAACASTDESGTVTIQSIYAAGASTLSGGDSASVLSILGQDGWVDDLTNCLVDVLLKLPDGSIMRYHSDCGTFVDYENQRSLNLDDSEQDAVNQIFAQYITLGISDAAPSQPDNSWGIALSLKDLSPTGATIVCTQSGGNPTGELQTGSYYVVERLTENGWEEVPQRELEGELAWTAEAWLVNMGGVTEWEVSWEWLYGTLPGGIYRIGKEFTDFRGTGDYDKMMVYAEFGIVENE